MQTFIENEPADRLETTSSREVAVSPNKSATRQRRRSQLDKATGDLGDRLITVVDVEGKTGLSRSTIYRYLEAGRFPRPVKFGATSRWSLREIDAWMADAIAARDNAA